MKPDLRDHARLDIARELDRLSRLRRDRNRLMQLADEIRDETNSFVRQLQNMQLDPDADMGRRLIARSGVQH